MANPIRKTALIKLNDKASYTPVKKDNGAGFYCLKEETRLDGPWEFGIKPMKRNDKTDWEAVKSQAKANNLDAIPDDIFVRYRFQLKDIAKHSYQTVLRTKPRECFWLWGETGTGKSKHILDTYGADFYPKM